MLIAWMVYAIAVTTIVAGCAIALDRVAEIWNQSRRPVWLVALAVAIGVPAGLALRPETAPQIAPIVDASATGIERQTFQLDDRQPPASPGARERFLTIVSRSFSAPLWNRAATLAWLASSLALSAMLLRGLLVLAFKRARWSSSEIDGHCVLVTTDVGPAVVGVVRPRILLPSWALALETEERAMMLEHEAEHVRARDPMLIAIAAWAIALFPWNPAMWLIVKRLRLAIEIDCDRRVIAKRRRDVRDYGLLLLTVGARSGNALQFGASLAEPRRFLEQRILAMTTARPSRPLVASAPFAVIALLAGVAVAQTPQPDSTLIVRKGAPPRVVLDRGADRVALLRDTLRIAEPPRIPDVVAIERRATPKPLADVTMEEPPRIVQGVPLRETQPIPIDVIRGWIQARHPNVIAGDSRVNAVTIVVDENNNFLASAADSIENIPSGKAPSILIRGRITADSVAVAPLPNPTPLFVVDGVVVDSPTQLDTIPIESVEVIKGQAAANAYGPEAQNGVIIIKSMRPDATQLRRLGVLPENIKEMTELRLSPGVIGPNRLYVAVLQLKKH